MPTTYRTKDGIVLQNVPDGTSEDVVKARIQKIRSDRDGANQPPPAQPPQPAKQQANKSWSGAARGWLEEGTNAPEAAKRLAGMAARGVNNAGMFALTAIPDVGVMGGNLLLGTNHPTLYKRFQDWQDERIAPPRNVAEQVVEQGVNFAAGAAIPLGPKIQNQFPVQSSAERAAGRAVREQAGDQGVRDILANKLRSYKSEIEGVRPTSAQAVSDIPEGSPIQSLQEAVAKVGGAKFGQPSVEFGRQLAGNKAARESAEKALSESHGKARTEIISKANNMSQRMRDLVSVIEKKTRHKQTAAQLSGEAEASALINANRTHRWPSSTAPILDRAKDAAAKAKGEPKPISLEAAEKIERPYLVSTARPPGLVTKQHADAKKAAADAEALTFEKDAAWLESAGAELEKGILESTGLNALGPKEMLAKTGGRLSDPRVYANEIATKTYSAFADSIKGITRNDGSIDAIALDEVRKSFGPKLARLFSKDGWDVKDAAFVRSMRSAQEFIDDAIEAAGGHGYKAEIKRYADKMRAIEDDALREADMYKSGQQTNTQLQQLIEDQVHKNVGSSLLNPKVALANIALRLKGNYVAPHAIGEISRLLRNPDDLALALSGGNSQRFSEALSRALQENAKKTVLPLAPSTQMKQNDQRN